MGLLPCAAPGRGEGAGRSGDTDWPPEVGASSSLLDRGLDWSPQVGASTGGIHPAPPAPPECTPPQLEGLVNGASPGAGMAGNDAGKRGSVQEQSNHSAGGGVGERIRSSVRTARGRTGAGGCTHSVFVGPLQRVMWCQARGNTWVGRDSSRALTQGMEQCLGRAQGVKSMPMKRGIL